MQPSPHRDARRQHDDHTQPLSSRQAAQGWAWTFTHVQLFATLWLHASRLPGVFRQEYWSGLPCPLGDLPQPGIKPMSPVSPVLQVDCVPLRYQGSLSGMQGVSEVRETGSGWFWGPLVGSSDRAVRTLCCGESSGACGPLAEPQVRQSQGSGWIVPASGSPCVSGRGQP